MKVILYGIATCSRCKTAQKILEKKKIEYQYKDLTVEDLPHLLGTYLPILEVDGVKYKGVDVFPKIRELVP